MADNSGYSAFGELAPRTGSTVNPFLFNAQQFDGASGNYYLRARYYDQSAGRFISQDPFEGRNEDLATLHRYLYAGANPISNTDPGGREFGLVGQVAVGAVLGALGGGFADYAITGKVHARSVIGAALFGAAILLVAALAGAGVALVPSIAGYSSLVGPGIYTAFGLSGVISAGKLTDFVLSRSSSTPGQKAAGIGLLITSIVGAKAASESFVGALSTGSRVVLSGHGSYDIGSGTTTIPPGTQPMVYGRFGSSISNDLGNAIETGSDLSGVYSKTYTSGMNVPNYTLHPPGNLGLMGNPTTVNTSTALGDLLQPGMGEVHWAACLYNAKASYSDATFDTSGVYDDFGNPYAQAP